MCGYLALEDNQVLFCQSLLGFTVKDKTAGDRLFKSDCAIDISMTR